MFDFSIVTNWIHELLLSIMPEGLAIFIECVAVGVCLVALYAILAIILIYMERKVCGFSSVVLDRTVLVNGVLSKCLRRAQNADQRNLHAEGCRPFPLHLAPFMVIIASS